ncbi:MAG: ClpXP protease specificity-enhancing factor SspB [Rhodobacteraceae bacterium]|nr:ClpXP protease specificity-enhancing factor SspB [Paracoccaceae bacterium]
MKIGRFEESVVRIDYSRLVFESFLDLVRKALVLVGEHGAPYLSGIMIKINSDHPGLVIPNYIKAGHPETMSIILQYTFDDLVVENDAFSVTLFFNDKPERLTIPFRAIISFEDLGRSILFTLDPGTFESIGAESAHGKESTDEVNNSEPAEIINLDSFRKAENRKE